MTHGGSGAVSFIPPAQMPQLLDVRLQLLRPRQQLLQRFLLDPAPVLIAHHVHHQRLRCLRGQRQQNGGEERSHFVACPLPYFIEINFFTTSGMMMNPKQISSVSGCTSISGK